MQRQLPLIILVGAVLTVVMLAWVLKGGDASVDGETVAGGQERVRGSDDGDGDDDGAERSGSKVGARAGTLTSASENRGRDRRSVVTRDGGVVLLIPPRLLAQEARQKGEKRKEWNDRIRRAIEDEAAEEERARARARDDGKNGAPDAGRRSWPVIFNELMARNQTATVDDRGQFDDWIEVFNRASVDVDLEGCAITDEPANPSRYLVFPAGSVIPPRGYLLVFADGKPHQGPLHAPFKLGAQGDMLVLVDPNGNAIDDVTFGPQQPDMSFGRIPDAMGPFITLRTPTPGAPNVESPALDGGMVLDAGVLDGGKRGPALGVVINELMADNAATIMDDFAQPSDWIELANLSSSPADLSDHVLTDDPAKAEQWKFPRGTLVAPNGYLLVWADGQGHQGALHTSFKLSPRGEQVSLIAPDGTVLDVQTYSSQGRDMSDGRTPDGKGVFTRQQKPTPGARNADPPDAGSVVTDGGPELPDAGTQKLEGVVINEWLANNAGGLTDERGEKEDWIELYNTRETAQQLGGACLSDEPANARKWCFPEGTAISPLGFLLVWADNEADGPLHASFKLSAHGETLTLVARDGTLVDSRSFGEQLADQSQGRVPDGVGAATTLHTPSPGAPNAH